MKEHEFLWNVGFLIIGLLMGVFLVIGYIEFVGLE